MALKLINLMDAFLIETIRSKGVSNEELIQKTFTKDFDAWKDLSTDVDVERLIELSEDKETFQSIIEEGYKIKFVTMNGLKNLMKLKFQINESHYQQIDNGLLNLRIKEDQFAILKQFLSDNWVIQEVHRSEGNLKVHVTVMGN